MGAGSYRDLLRIERPDGATDAAGQPTDTWVLVSEVYADIRYQRGAEAIRAGAVASLAQVSVRVRQMDLVTSGMRLVHELDGRVFEVTAVLPDSRRRHTDIVCKVQT